MSAHVRFVEGERPGSCSSARRRWRQGEPSIANLLLPPSRLHLRNLNLHQGLARGMVYCLLDCIPKFWMSDGLFLCFPRDCWSSVASMIGSVFLSLYLPSSPLWYLSTKTQHESETMCVSCFSLRSCWCRYIFRCDLFDARFSSLVLGRMESLANAYCKLSWYWVMHLQGTKIIGASKPSLTPRRCTSPAQQARSTCPEVELQCTHIRPSRCWMRSCHYAAR